MKKSLLLGFLTAVLLSAVLLALPAGAADTPSARIAAKNCSFTDTVCLVFYGDFQNVPAGAETGILLWRTAPAAYTYENAEERITVSSGTAPFEGVSYPVYAYRGLYAKNMTDAVYAVPYIKDGETVVYGETLKYSILRYAYQILGYLGKGSGNESMKTLVREMLDYGAAAQNYFGYRTDALATDRFYQITVENGVLSDGTKEGLYKPGASLTLTAVMPDGETFDHWEDGAGNNIGTNPTLNITMDSKNAGYTAAAASEVPADTLAFVSNGDGTCYVGGIGAVTGGEVVVPQTSPEGDKVTGIGEKAFADCTTVTGITLPNTIKTIGTRAFYGCTGLTEFTIPESVTSIGTQIFYKAGNLKTIFYNAGCTSNDNLKNTPSVDHVVFGGKTVPDYICENAVNIKTVEILDGVTSIGEAAFSGCSSLSSVTIPDSVTRVGEAAFSGCTSLISVTIPDNVTSIGYQAFYGCSSLTSVTIPNSVTSIGIYAFYDCSSLTSVTIPDSVTSIGYLAFYGCSTLTSVTIPDSVTSIGRQAFGGCFSIKSVYITDIESWLNIHFYEDSSNPLYSGADLYLNGTKLTELVIPDTVTSIGDSAFCFCSSLTSVTIPDSVMSIGNYAFYNCYTLKDITYSGTVIQWNSIIKSNSWANADYITVHCTDDNVVCSFLSFTTNGDGTCYVSRGSCSSRNMTIPEKSPAGDTVTSIGNYAFRECSFLTSVTIPDSVTDIGNYAFASCSSLTSVTIPDSVTSIGWDAFLRCTSLTSVIIPDSVTSIGSSAFTGCSSLTSVTISDSVTSIGSSAFSGCSSLTTVTIPDSVTSIAPDAFAHCSSLTSVTIPDSVIDIYYDVFYYCFSLKDIYYSGTKIQWNNITKGSGWDRGTDSYTVHCADGDISK